MIESRKRGLAAPFQTIPLSGILQLVQKSNPLTVWDTLPRGGVFLRAFPGKLETFPGKYTDSYKKQHIRLEKEG